MALDSLSQLNGSYRSLSSGRLSGLSLWLLYHCQVRREGSSVTLSLSEERKSGMLCHVKQRIVRKMVPCIILQLVFRKKKKAYIYIYIYII